MPPLTAGVVREYLSSVAAGEPPATDLSTFEQLRKLGALSGSAGGPTITPIGQRVLQELNIRSYRVDSMGLQSVSEEMALASGELDAVAHQAEYFLGEIGPLTPPETLPYMRISAAGLANRRTSPEELAEIFRNTWGMVEVMEGRADDRLLAAELLVGSNVPVSRIYAQIVNTTETLEHPTPEAAMPIATSTILHLFPEPAPEAHLDGYRAWRKALKADDLAALLARMPLAETQAAIARLEPALSGGSAPPPDLVPAAVYLVLALKDPAAVVDRVRALSAKLAGRLPSTLVAAAMLAVRHPLSAEELSDWVDKAAAIAKTRKLAPSPPELQALGVALVEGLEPTRFAMPSAPTPVRAPEGELAMLKLLALHSWIYRPTLELASARPGVERTQPS